jgi:hypothetical protein
VNSARIAISAACMLLRQQAIGAELASTLAAIARDLQQHAASRTLAPAERAGGTTASRGAEGAFSLDFHGPQRSDRE